MKALDGIGIRDDTGMAGSWASLLTFWLFLMLHFVLICSVWFILTCFGRLIWWLVWVDVGPSFLERSGRFHSLLARVEELC